MLAPSRFLWVMTVLELLAGLGLLLAPASALDALLGVAAPLGETIGVTRLAGVALSPLAS